MKRLKKVGILLLILLIFTSQVNLSYKRAEAATTAIAPNQTAFTGVMTAITAIGAAAVGGKKWLEDNTEEIRATARETWGLMTQDMKDNFATSMSNAADGIVVSGDIIENFLSNLAPRTSAYDLPVNQGEIYTLPDGYLYQLKYLTLTETLSELDISDMTLSYGGQGTNGLYSVRLYLPIKGTYYSITNTRPKGSYFQSKEEAEEYADTTSIMQALRDFGLLTIVTADGLPVTSNPTFDRINDYLRDRAIPNGELDNIRVPAPVPMTLDGTKLNYDTLTGLLTLPDGIPWEGNPDTDLVWNIPNIGVTTVDIDGVPTDIPIAQTKDGAWINILTGEIVIPAETDVPVDSEIPPNINSRPIKDKSESIGALVTTRFPFSLPWDFAAMLALLYAEPKTPKWEVKGTEKIPINFNIDLKFLDPYISWFRAFIFAGFVVSVIFLHRKFMGGQQ